MSSIVICPHCDRKLKVPEAMAGKSCRCPGCKFLIPPAEEPEVPASSRAVKREPASQTAPLPARARRPREDELEDDLEIVEEEPIRAERPRKRKPSRRQSSTGLIIGLAAGGGLLLLLMLVGGGWALLHFLRDKVGSDAGWQTFTPPGGDCTVLMPGIPVSRSQNMLDASGQQYLVGRKNGDEAFAIVIFDVPSRALRPSLLEELTTFYRNGVMNSLGGGQGSSNTPVSLGNISGLEFQAKLTARKGSLIGRTFLVRIGGVHRIYLLGVVSESSQPKSGDAARFLDSFKITAAAAPPDFTAPLAGGAAQLPPAFNPPKLNPPSTPLRPGPGSRMPRGPRRLP